VTVAIGPASISSGTKTITITGGLTLTVTPAEGCAMLIEPTAVDVVADHTCAQLRAGKTYTFYPGALDVTMSYLGDDPSYVMDPGEYSET